MKKSMRSGFTLIELMVVVVLVMILALAIVPTFRDIINKAKYTEGSSAISALRTNIKVYQIDYGRLPGLDANFVADPITANGCSPSLINANVNVDTAGSTLVVSPTVQILSSRVDQYWLLGAQDPTTTNFYTNVVSATTQGESPLQKDLNIKYGDYAGAYFVNEDYQYMIINGGKSPSSGTAASGYAYAIAVTAGAGGRKPDIGTGYAVMEVYNTGWQTERITGTWERYSASKNPGRLFLQCVANSSDYTANGTIIPVPTWSALTNTTYFCKSLGGGTNTVDAAKLKSKTGWIL